MLSKISPFRTSREFSITKGLKFGFSLFCRVLLLAFFFPHLFLFRVYFVATNDITILPASSVCITDCCPKTGLFRTSGEFSITNSLKFGFSLSYRVLLFVLFFCACFYFMFFWFGLFFCSYWQLRSVWLFSATDSKYH